MGLEFIGLTLNLLVLLGGMGGFGVAGLSVSSCVVSFLWVK